MKNHQPNLDFLTGSKHYRLRNGKEVAIVKTEQINGSMRWYGHELDAPEILLIWFANGNSPLGYNWDLVKAIHWEAK